MPAQNRMQVRRIWSHCWNSRCRFKRSAFSICKFLMLECASINYNLPCGPQMLVQRRGCKGTAQYLIDSLSVNQEIFRLSSNSRTNYPETLRHWTLSRAIRIHSVMTRINTILSPAPRSFTQFASFTFPDIIYLQICRICYAVYLSCPLQSLISLP